MTKTGTAQMNPAFNVTAIHHEDDPAISGELLRAPKVWMLTTPMIATMRRMSSPQRRRGGVR